MRQVTIVALREHTILAELCAFSKPVLFPSLAIFESSGLRRSPRVRRSRRALPAQHRIAHAAPTRFLRFLYPPLGCGNDALRRAICDPFHSPTNSAKFL